MLTRAYDLSTSAPLLFRKVALQLAALHSTPLGDDFECHVSADARIAAYYHQAAVGASSAQQHRTILDTKLAALSRTSETEVRHWNVEEPSVNAVRAEHRNRITTLFIIAGSKDNKIFGPLVKIKLVVSGLMLSCVTTQKGCN